MRRSLKLMKKLAIIEATNLKKYATAEEINELDIEELDPDHTSRCIYGLMTGYCYSDRANELILQCCTRVYESNLKEPDDPDIKDAKLNGKPMPTINRRYAYHSPIETLILNDTPKKEYQKKLIRFLKGKTKTLSFDDSK
jgi:hypothetical protein